MPNAGIPVAEVPASGPRSGRRPAFADRDLPVPEVRPLAPAALAAGLGRPVGHRTWLAVQDVLAGREVFAHVATQTRTDVGAWFWRPRLHLLLTPVSLFTVAWLDWGKALLLRSEDHPLTDLTAVTYNYADGMLAFGQPDPRQPAWSVSIPALPARRFTAILSAHMESLCSNT